jgi:serine protease Do
MTPYNVPVPRRFLVALVCLTTTSGILVGLILAGSITPTPAISAPETRRPVLRTAVGTPASPASTTSFADIAERLNPAVVNIDASVREGWRSARRRGTPDPDDGTDLFGRPLPRERELPRRGAGTGFFIDATGYILTNHHVIDGADRIMVRLTDGRTLRAERVGSDPDTDIALIKVESPQPFTFAMLGDSDTLRVGEWVVAIGNPLAYEHTVTVGIVSYLGRKLFNSSLDRYIQTDAAINFGNSGGPLINAHGEVIGINAAISSRASNIGFAVPINQASAILPQLREAGRVSRGYIGVEPRDVDPDLQRSLRLRTTAGALVQDVRPGSPASRAGLRAYDLVIAIDGAAVEGSDELIRNVAARRPGTIVTLQVLRDGRAMNVPVKLAERPLLDRRATPVPPAERPQPSSQRGPALGLMVRDLDAETAEKLRLPDDTAGVLVSRVEPLSPAFDADIERNHVLLEINRQPVRSIEDYRRLTARLQPGEVVALYVYKESGRELVTLRLD